ncbi:DVUA0089 family protein [Siccirubricoccus sp. G192]|uniref:DVUA0089 family protein n=1 Tax=Siccirubricoccus sp. G192 TaxID=2849651 RepID=UPI001C2BB98A|nr:DVUA0089 family protein [Siccirubricoccus sp. G192]MBV1799813.1 PEP-CTERM sorting domain-containing protein [Siccirubricoccus sp. G192]
MRRFKQALLAAVVTVAVGGLGAAQAADFSFTGSLSDPNQVLLFNFDVGATSTVTLRTYSYAGGTNAAGQVIPGGGFDPILALFDGSGALIDENDDGDGNVPADPVTGNHYDTFLQALLAPGSYTVSVQTFANFANGPNLSDGFSGFGSFNNRATNWAFDVLNAGEATQVAVPEPASLGPFGAGLVALGLTRRRKARQAA